MRTPRPTRRAWRGTSRGQIIILIALLLSALMAFGGLAVDMIFVYAVRVRLVTATDATALAVARALGRGTNLAEQEAEVLRVSDLIFKSNFPSDLMLTGGSRTIADGPWIAGPGVSSGGIRVQDASVSAGTRQVRLSTAVNVPTFFFRIFGIESVPMTARAVAARQDVNLMIVMDRSASLHPNNADAWTEVQQASSFFVHQFDNTTDRVGLVSFGTGAAVDVPLDSNFKTTVTTAINAQIMPESAATNSAYGMMLGVSELLALSDPDALNVIVFFTDGQPSAYTAEWATRLNRKFPADAESPYCDTTTKTGVAFAYQDGTGQFHNMGGLFNPNPTSPATTFYADSGRSLDHQMVAGCGSDSNAEATKDWGARGEWLLDETAGCWPTEFEIDYTSPIVGRSTVNDFKIDYDDGPWGIASDFCGAGLFDEDAGTENQRGENVHNAAKNGTLDAAYQFRQLGDNAYVYSIGLGGWGYPADADFLGRVANDPDNPSHDSTQNLGSYVYAPSQAQLRQAFAIVANEIFRLIQ